jgi:hypothetical protein
MPLMCMYAFVSGCMALVKEASDYTGVVTTLMGSHYD